MSEAVAQIVAQIVTLSQQERAELAHAFLLSLEPEDPDVEEAWQKELARRDERLRNGEAIGIPAKEVFDELRRGRK
jgi:putative addiction module component (TIGR02574 family)